LPKSFGKMKFKKCYSCRKDTDEDKKTRKFPIILPIKIKA